MVAAVKCDAAIEPAPFLGRHHFPPFSAFRVTRSPVGRREPRTWAARESTAHPPMQKRRSIPTARKAIPGGWSLAVAASAARDSLMPSPAGATEDAEPLKVARVKGNVRESAVGKLHSVNGNGNGKTGETYRRRESTTT